MILDAAQITLGVLLGLTIAASIVTVVVLTTRALTRTRAAWWIRARLAIRRARPTRAGR